MLRLLTIAAGIGLLGQCALAQQKNDVLDSVRSVCEPPLRYAATSSSVFLADKDYQADMFEHICSLKVSTVEEAQQQGVEVDTVINKTPIGFLWSNDSARKKQAREQFCSTKSDKSRTKDLLQLSQQAGNAEAAVLYNQCVSDALGSITAGTPLTCKFEETGTPENVLLTVSYIKRTSDPDPKVSSGDLVNGVIRLPLSDVPTAVSESILAPAYSAAQFGRSRSILPIVGQTLTPGTRVFVVNRRDPKLETSVVVNASNGWSCKHSIGSGYVVSLTASVWPTGKKIVPAVQTRRLERMVGCTDKVNDQIEVCLPDNVPIEHKDVHEESRNGSSFMSAPEVKPGASCYVVPYQVEGKGRGPFGDCKGRGWLYGTITISGKGPRPPLKSLPMVHFSTPRIENFTNKIYLYDSKANIPEDIGVEKWRYKVNVVEISSNGKQEFEMDESHPNAGGYFTEIAGGSLLIRRPTVGPGQGKKPNPPSLQGESTQRLLSVSEQLIFRRRAVTTPIETLTIERREGEVRAVRRLGNYQQFRTEGNRAELERVLRR